MWNIFDLIFPPRPDELLLRGITPDGFLELLRPRLAVGTRPEAVTLLSFGSPLVRAAVHEAKYHRSERAFTLLSLALTDYLHDLDDGFTKSLILVPVPLGMKRQKERGYNQVEEVIKRAARELDLVVDASLLTRIRETESQVSLAREKREENMRGAFGAALPADPSATYILIDDVMTTGATLQAAIDALALAGATNIIPLALAH